MCVGVGMGMGVVVGVCGCGCGCLSIHTYNNIVILSKKYKYLIDYLCVLEC